MAKLELPENLKDDILNETMGGKRRYLITRNEDGSFCIEDVSVYDQIGDVLGQARVNAMCRAINESVDHAKIIESVDDLAAITEEGYVVGGKAGAQIINNLKGFEPVLDTTGQITGYKTSVGGADTVFPFRKEPQFLSDNIIYNRYIKYTNTSSRDQLVFGMAAYYFFDDILKAEYRTGGKVNILHVTKESSHSFVIIGVTAILSPGGSIEMYTHNATSSQGDSHSKVGYMVFDF